MFWKNNKPSPKKWGLSSDGEMKTSLWFQFDHCLEENISVRLNNYPLRTYTLNDLVTADIPVLLMKGVDQACVSLHHMATGQIIWTGQYTFNADWQFPNTFLVGAPRSGTTYIAQALGQHPEIYLCPIKEPMFHSKETRSCVHDAVRSEEDYRALFLSAPSDAKIRIDGSTHYLSSIDALETITKDYDNPKIIVCLRHPIRAAVSMHKRNLQGGIYETESSFETAWRQSVDHDHSRNITNNYSSMFKIGTQVEGLLKLFNRDQVHIALFDDLYSDPKTFIHRIIDFLELETHHDFVQHARNSAQLDTDLHSYLGASLYNEMERFFKPEIKKLQKIIGQVSLNH